MAVAERGRRVQERAAAAAAEAAVRSSGEVMLPEQAPPGSPPLPGNDPASPQGPDNASISTVASMVQSAINLQFSIAERLDTKIKTYFGFAAAAFGAAQAIVLRHDVHSRLGKFATDALPFLAWVAAGGLVIALLATIWALTTKTEHDLPGDKLRAYLERGFLGDVKAGPDGINLLIGLLVRRQDTNRTRVFRLRIVILMSALVGLACFLEILLAVGSVT
jgi:hypothetical protein